MRRLWPCQALEEFVSYDKQDTEDRYRYRRRSSHHWPSLYHLRATKTAPSTEMNRARVPDIAVCTVDAADILPGLVAPWTFCMPACPFDVASMLGSM